MHRGIVVHRVIGTMGLICIIILPLWHIEHRNTNTWGHGDQLIPYYHGDTGAIRLTILPLCHTGMMGGETSDTNTWGHSGTVLANTILPWWRIGLMGGGD